MAADSHGDGAIAPRRSLGGPILPPPPPQLAEGAQKRESDEAAAREAEARQQAERETRQAEKDARKQARSQPATKKSPAPRNRPDRTKPAPKGRTRRAQLRIVQVDAWSVMKTAFLLSIALGIVLVVAVAIIWGVLGAAGVWDSINSIVQQAVGSDQAQPFDIEEYVGTSRVLGFTMIVAVLDVILITAIATLGAFLYNLSAALLGGIEVTLAEDN